MTFRIELDSIDQITREVLRQKDSYILESLNELISRGLLEVHETQPVLVRESDSMKITLKQSVKLVLKDQEYIEKLEKENQELKEKLKNIKQSITGL